MNDDGARGLEQVPFEIADIECTLQRWVREACDLAGGLFTVGGRYPPGSEGVDEAGAMLLQERLPRCKVLV